MIAVHPKPPQEQPRRRMTPRASRRRRKPTTAAAPPPPKKKGRPYDAEGRVYDSKKAYKSASTKGRKGYKDHPADFNLTDQDGYDGSSDEAPPDSSLKKVTGGKTPISTDSKAPSAKRKHQTISSVINLPDDLDFGGLNAPSSKHTKALLKSSPSNITTDAREDTERESKRQKGIKELVKPPSGKMGKQASKKLEEADLTFEGEEEPESHGTGIYCTCQNSSHGDMVKCSNRQCLYQWFHYGCVGLSEEPRGKWLCSRCQKAQLSKIAKNGGGNKGSDLTKLNPKKVSKVTEVPAKEDYGGEKKTLKYNTDRKSATVAPEQVKKTVKEDEGEKESEGQDQVEATGGDRSKFCRSRHRTVPCISAQASHVEPD